MRRLEPGDDCGHEGVELRLAHRAAVLQRPQHQRGEAVRKAVVVQLYRSNGIESFELML